MGLLPSISPRVAAVGGRCPEVSIPAGYSPAAQEDNINCTSEEVFTQESFMAPNHTKFSCKFTADMLQNCSGLVDPNFGFEEGKPCFIIKMNRVSIKGLEIRDPVRGLLWRLLWGGGSGCVAHPATRPHTPSWLPEVAGQICTSCPFLTLHFHTQPAVLA